MAERRGLEGFFRKAVEVVHPSVVMPQLVNRVGDRLNVAERHFDLSAPGCVHVIAIGKAAAAVGMGVASRTLLERAQGNPIFFGALPAVTQGRFIPQTGAVVIKDKDGNVIGAAGASGGTGDEDEAVCIAGIEAVGLAWG